MTEAMPFLRKLILLSYAPRPLQRGFYHIRIYLMDSPASFLALISRRASR